MECEKRDSRVECRGRIREPQPYNLQLTTFLTPNNKRQTTNSKIDVTFILLPIFHNFTKCPTYKKIKKQFSKKWELTSLILCRRRRLEAIAAKPAVILLSPTGSGKTLAFLLPIIEMLSLKKMECRH
jgi:hypothetical protein